MRLHLFEWEDQGWFPAPLRAAMTSYLATTYRITPFPKLWADCLAKLMKREGVTEIVDLGSGSGGPSSWSCAGSRYTQLAAPLNPFEIADAAAALAERFCRNVGRCHCVLNREVDPRTVSRFTSVPVP